MLVDHVGRKSGQQHTSPLIKHPMWRLNLRDQPETTVQVGSEKRAVRARGATPEEKQRLWPICVDVYAPYEEYQRKTERDIPVIVLERA